MYVSLQLRVQYVYCRLMSNEKKKKKKGFTAEVKSRPVSVERCAVGTEIGIPREKNDRNNSRDTIETQNIETVAFL